MKLTELEMQEAKLSDDEKKLKTEMAMLGLKVTEYDTHKKLGFIVTSNSVRYKPEMAHNENFVKDGKLVHKWREVGGDFLVRDLGLTSLEGSPTKVGNSFDCAANHLTSLEGAPEEIGNSFNCGQNNITTLTGVNDIIKSVRNFYFTEKKIKSGAMDLLQIEKLQKISCSTPAFKIVAKYIGHPEQIFDCQNELIEAGYEGLAE